MERLTSEEIKQTYSMRDILSKCGLPQPNRAGFIQCPFHKGDREASMKIYEHDFHCFGCGANGDIFRFVQMYDGLSFKDAFLSLGGTYEKPTFESKLAIYKAKKAREMRKKEEIRNREKKKLNNDLIDIYRDCYRKAEPLSDAWCDSYNALQYQLYLHEVYAQEEARKTLCSH